MKNLFDPVLLKDTHQRIICLRPDSERQWGQLPITQMLSHCTAGLHMAMGVINPRRAPFPNIVIGLLIKPIVFGNDKPMRRNPPSVPELFVPVSTKSGFDWERNKLSETVDRFASMGEACCSRHPHPFFGPLKPHQWAILMYKHLDHHLSQFGA